MWSWRCSLEQLSWQISKLSGSSLLPKTFFLQIHHLSNKQWRPLNVALRQRFPTLLDKRVAKNGCWMNKLLISKAHPNQRLSTALCFFLSRPILIVHYIWTFWPSSSSSQRWCQTNPSPRCLRMLSLLVSEWPLHLLALTTFEGYATNCPGIALWIYKVISESGSKCGYIQITLYICSTNVLCPLTSHILILRVEAELPDCQSVHMQDLSTRKDSVHRLVARQC